MPEDKRTLPPDIAQWLASGKPALREKAEAALRTAEPDTNNLLFEQIEKERRNAMFIYMITLCFSSLPFQFATHFGSHISVRRICLGILLMLPGFFIGVRLFVLPAGNRYIAMVLALARRYDVRAMPFILTFWQPRFNKKTSHETDAALFAVLQKAAPGNVYFSRERNAKDRFALLRTQFNALLIRRKGAFVFRAASIATPEKVQIWLALLSHLNVDSSLKGRLIMQRVANARALTLDEEVLQNAAHAFIYGAPGKALKERDAGLTATPALHETWKPTETSETPTLLQRLGRR